MNGFSLNQEMTIRLDRSLRDDEVGAAVFRTRQRYELLETFDRILRITELRLGKEASLEDPRALPLIDRLSPGSEVLSDTVARSAAEAQTLAQAHLDESVKQMLTGRGRAPGNPLIRAGTMLQLAGLGLRASGHYRVTSATHAFSQGSYSTRFDVAWSPT